jgi:hypothetical protein
MDANSTLEHINELRGHVSTEFFVGFDDSRFPYSTVPVLALVAHAYAAELKLGESVSFEVRDWLFERGADVSEPDTLAAIAHSFGLGLPDPDDYATVVSEWKEGRRRHVAGSPHFFCAGTSVFCPSLQISKNPQSGGRTIQTNLIGLQAFLDRCLSTEAQATTDPSSRDSDNQSE